MKTSPKNNPALLRREFRVSLFTLAIFTALTVYTIYRLAHLHLADLTLTTSRLGGWRGARETLRTNWDQLPWLIVAPIVACCNAAWCLRLHRAIRRAPRL